MPITNASPENILRYLHAAGTGTKEAMKSATSPRGILEWFVNFFTCGGVRKSNERCFQEVIGKLTTSLLYVNKDAFFDGNKISGGCQRVYYMSVMWSSIRKYGSHGHY